MDGDVRIPIFLDFEDSDFEKELSGLKSKLLKLKSSLDEISKSRTDRLGLYDSAKLAVADRTITHIRDTVQKLGKENIDNKTWENLLNSYKEGARAIDDVINKNEALKKSMANVGSSKDSQKKNDWANITNANELAKYTDALETRLQKIRDLLTRAPSGKSDVIDQTRERMEKEIATIKELISEIGKYQQALSESSDNAKTQTMATSALSKSGASDEEVEAQRQVAKEARQAYAEMERSSAEATNEIKVDVHERMYALMQEEKRLSAVIGRYETLQRLYDKGRISSDTFRTRLSNSDEFKELGEMANANSKVLSSIEQLSDAERRLAKARTDSADAANKEVKANKGSTASYYYKLRAIKMLGHTFDDVYKAMDRFGKKAVSVAKSSLSAYAKLLPGVWAVQKAMQKATTQQKKFGRELKSTTREHEGFNISLKKALTTILKYGFGIRSLYILFRKLRKAISDGIGEMSQQFEDVNVRMSSILTSVNYMKASLTTIAEPLITLLAPALEKIAEIVANISYHVASFIAALSGQKNVYKAVKVQADYAESLDKTAKNAKKAKKELAGFDELNVLHSNDDDEKDYTMGWELVPALSEAFPIIDKIKDILSTLFDPIKKAWEKMKDFVINSFKYMVERLKSLAGTIWDDFLKVWTDGRVQKIFEDIFKIIGDIFLIVGNLAEAFEEAWKANDNGYRVLSAIVDILGIIVDGIKRCADITVEWSKKLTFVPLFTAIADVMEQQVVPAVQKVVDLFVYLYEHVFLELVRYVVEDLAPTLVRAFGNVIETVGNIAEKIRQALETNDLGDKIIAQFEKLVTIVGDKILEVSEKTKEWSKGLDFTALFEAVLNFLEKIEPLVQTVANVVGALWTDVLLPFWEYIIEDGGPRLLDLLGQIFGQKDENTGFGIDWEKVTNDINALLPALEKFLELAWDVLLQIIQDLGKAFDDFVNSDNFTKIIEGFKDWVDNADPEEIAKKIETFVKVFIECYAAFKLVSQVIMPIVTGFMTVGNAINNLIGAKGIGGLLSGLGKISPIAVGVIAVIGLMVASFGGVGNTLKEVKERVDDVKKHFADFGEKMNLSEKIEKLQSALERLRPVFEFLLDVIGGVVTVLGETFLGAISGVADMLSGTIDIIVGVFDTLKGALEVVVGVFTNDTEMISQGWSDMVSGVKEIGGGFVEWFAGIFDSISSAIAGFVDLALPDAASKILEWKDKVVGFFEDLAYKLIGDPIVYDIQDGVEEGFSGFIEETLSGVTGWVKDVIGKFSDLKDNIGEGIKGAKDAVVNKFTEIKEGIFGESAETKEGASNDFSTMAQSIMTTLSSNPLTEAATQFIGSFKTGIDTEFPLVTADIDTNIATILQNFATNFSSLTLLDEAIAFLQGALTGFQQIWPSITQFMDSAVQELLALIKNVINGQTLPEAGMEFIQGLNDALEQSFGVTLEDVVSNLEEIISSFREYLDPRTLYGIFIDFMQGGEDGLMSKLQSLLARVTEICNQIIAKVEAVFDIGSPSKVFFGIGEYLMEGMANGIEEDKSEVTDSFNDLVPDDSFTDKFIRSLDVMKNRAVDVVTTMANSMGDVMDNLDLVSSVDTMYNSMKKLDKIKVPNIAMGSVLPSTAQFRGTNQYDPSQMANAVKSAMIESMADMRYNGNSNNEDIVVQIDGYEVFRAVRNQSDMFKSSAGYGVL